MTKKYTLSEYMWLSPEDWEKLIIFMEKKNKTNEQ